MHSVGGANSRCSFHEPRGHGISPRSPGQDRADCLGTAPTPTDSPHSTCETERESQRSGRHGVLSCYALDALKKTARVRGAAARSEALKVKTIAHWQRLLDMGICGQIIGKQAPENTKECTRMQQIAGDSGREQSRVRKVEAGRRKCKRSCPALACPDMV
eukprot:6174847-Pleurochrysis_carterae.AAC.2